MKIRVFSDVHNEIRRYYMRKQYTPWVPSELDTDKDSILILAGDIDHAKKMPKYLNMLGERFKYVIHVAGNHEFYSTSIVDGRRNMQKNLADNVFHLDNQSVVLDGQKFFGGTMWTPLHQLSPQDQWDVARNMNDYKMIRKGGTYGYSPITPKFVGVLHDEFIQALHNSVNKDTIVISHHNPLDPINLTDSGGAYQRGLKPTDFAYGASLEDTILDLRPKVWISGHIHKCYDREWFGTRLISNCVGYFGEEDSDLNKELFHVDTD